ncbi:outer membrane protein [Wenxinia saemankumensis]|uniref:Outer membrane immunogenic protein n=1 Tax=Wenxinia saemankumensis TaxID=1447782 RepID=A0A1M6ARE1_9RHOB|nr:outer membrane beta-barrel protein [Wenxinia saemankumensis]SHI38997.1 outer membrane immunogenic protein [Wenxinia saemankumensis]
MKLHLCLPLVLLAGPALAAGMDSPVMEPAPVMPVAQPAPRLSWDGFYAGAQLGGAFDDETGVLSLEAAPSAPPAAAFGDNFYGAFDSGFSGGVHVGYDRQFGGFVLGGIADISALDVTETQGGDSATPAFYREVRSLDYYATLRGRVGVPVFERGLFYVHGGLAYGDVDYRFDTNTPATVTTSGDGDGETGYVVGAGMETMLTDSFSFGVEYQYVNLGESDFNTTLSGPGAPGGPFGAGVDAFGSEDDFDFHVIQARVSYRF